MDEQGGSTKPEAAPAQPEWSELSEKEARQFYRVPPEILRALTIANELAFPLYAKKKSRIRLLSSPEQPVGTGVLLKLANRVTDANQDDTIEVLIRRSDSPAYRLCLKAAFKSLSDVLGEEIEQAERHDAPVATQIDYSGRQPLVTRVEERVGKGTAVGKRAPDFSLQDHTDKTVRASELWGRGPVMLVFYPSNFSPICTKQLCAYNDQFGEFKKFGLTILGISDNLVSAHKKFAESYGFTFPLLSDPNKRVAKLYDASSLLMFGAVSRAVFIINKGGIILYRYVEPTILTHRKAEELVGIVRDLDATFLLDPTKQRVAKSSFATAALVAKDTIWKSMGKGPVLWVGPLRVQERMLKKA